MQHAGDRIFRMPSAVQVDTEDMVVSSVRMSALCSIASPEEVDGVRKHYKEWVREHCTEQVRKHCKKWVRKHYKEWMCQR